MIKIPTTNRRAFTLIETLVAITLLMMAVIAPMSLASQSLSSAYYARDEITASNLAQEAIEAVRDARDGQILQLAIDPSATVNIFGPIPVDADFIIDTASNAVTLCNTYPGGVCPPIKTDGSLFGYTTGWTNTAFTRTVHASYVPGSTDEMRVRSTVTWRTGSYPARSTSIHENLYRWVNDNN